MKITVIEPLNVANIKMEEYKQKFKNMGIKFEYYKTKAKTEKQLYERAKDSEILVIANTVFKSSVLEKLDKTKYISVAFTGFDHIDVNLASKKGIIVSNSSGYSDICVAELVIGQLLNVYRKFRKKGVHKGFEIYKKNVGILGHGKIGKRVHKLFISFGAKVRYYDPYVKTSDDLTYVLKNSDIVTLHMPYNNETKNFIDYEKLCLLKKDAVLINTSREGILNTNDLKKALDEKKLSAVILDVIDDKKILEKYKNVYLTDHIAYLTNESMLRRLDICMNNVIEYINGNIINKVN